MDSSPIFTFLKHNVPGQTAADLVHSMETSWNFEKARRPLTCCLLLFQWHCELGLHSCI